MHDVSMYMHVCHTLYSLVYNTVLRWAEATSVQDVRRRICLNCARYDAATQA